MSDKAAEAIAALRGKTGRIHRNPNIVEQQAPEVREMFLAVRKAWQEGQLPGASWKEIHETLREHGWTGSHVSVIRYFRSEEDPC